MESERKSPPFIPKKHRDGAEVAEKREGWGTLKFKGGAALEGKPKKKATQKTKPQGLGTRPGLQGQRIQVRRGESDTFDMLLGVGFEEFAEEGRGVFAEKAIVGTKGGEEVGVNVEFTGDFAMNEDGDDDFGFGFERAGEVAGIAADVVNDDGLARAGSGAANALVERDAGVGRHGAVEGAENEDVAIGFLFEQVEAHPVVFGELAVKERDDAFHQGFAGSGCDGQSV